MKNGRCIPVGSDRRKQEDTALIYLYIILKIKNYLKFLKMNQIHQIIIVLAYLKKEKLIIYMYLQ